MFVRVHAALLLSSKLTCGSAALLIGLVTLAPFTSPFCVGGEKHSHPLSNFKPFHIPFILWPKKHQVVPATVIEPAVDVEASEEDEDQETASGSEEQVAVKVSRCM